MSKKKAEEFRRERASDLIKLSDLLEGILPSFDAGQVKAAADQCKSQDFPERKDWDYSPSRYTWGYELSYLIFSGYHPSSDLKPCNAREHEVTLFMDVTVIGQSDNLEDPFSVLEMELRVRGSDGNRQLHGAWHLDKHKGSQADTARAVHPEYHMQHGGKNLWENANDYGDLVIPEPPRLAHPPLDAVLAIDFVLSNFFWQHWRVLSRESIYIDLVSRAQELFWKPYVKALASAWKPGPYEDETWAANQVWPQLNKEVGL